MMLSVVGPAALSSLASLLSSRLDRLVAVRTFANASIMGQGGRSAVDPLDRWGDDKSECKRALLEILRGSPFLQELDLTAIGMKECEAVDLAAALYGKSLLDLPGAWRQQDRQQSEDLSDGMCRQAEDPVCAWIQKLRGGNEWGFGQPQVSLTTLKLEHNDLSVRAVRALMVPVTDMRNLTRLEMGGNRLDEQGASALCQALTGGPRLTLKVLGLGDCDLGPAGVAALAPALRRLTNLSDLDLNANRLTARGGTSLSRSLRSCTSLVALTVNFNFLGKEGTQALAPLLGAQESLTNLDMSFNDMGPSGAAVLVEAFKRRDHVALVRLDLSKNTLGARGANELFPLMRRLGPTLQYLGLKFNGLGQQHSAIINCQVPRARVEVVDL